MFNLRIAGSNLRNKLFKTGENFVQVIMLIDTGWIHKPRWSTSLSFFDALSAKYGDEFVKQLIKKLAFAKWKRIIHKNPDNKTFTMKRTFIMLAGLKVEVDF